MKKLQNKVFWVIFLILSIFLLSILFIFNYQDYKNEEDSVKKNLIGMEDEQKVQHQGGMQQFDASRELDDSKIFVDAVVYTAILDGNNEIISVINHSQNSVSDETIESIAQNIIDNDDEKSTHIGILYFEEYSYSFRNDNTLVIIDNTQTRERLLSTLNSSILIFVILELVIIYISVKLTSWIIKPVIESFDKQKQFIADASHELKTPLAVIIASSEALDNDPNEKKWLNNIKFESERMNRLITNLLDMAKLESGVKEQYIVENLSKTVERTVLTFESIIYEKNIKLNYDIEENLKFNCNNSQMEQLVSIILDNAIKHSSDDGEIRVNLKKEKNNLILEITNKGKEIPKEEREKIFERFYRSDESRNRNDNRYGLGLAIAKNIVENHNGKISVNCADGYTTFKVVLKKNL